MSEPSEHPIIVSAQERAHPALRKLARACIALARQLQQPPKSPTAAGEEPRHD
jgi:hypothetical protein